MSAWALVLLMGAASTTASHPLIVNVDGRKATSLDGTWQAIVDPYEDGYYDFHYHLRKDGYFKNAKPQHPSDRVEYDFAASDTLLVPGDWNSQRDELFFYEGTVWYERELEVHPVEGRRQFLYFGAVNYQARVFLNGEELGFHEGGFTPFNLEVTGRLKDGANVLVVKADNARHRDAVPMSITDWWNYGGITRRVLLVDVPGTFIRDYHVRLSREEPDQIVGWVQLDGPRLQQKVTLRLPENQAETTVTTDANGYAELRLAAADLERWSPEHPRLYQVRLAAETDQVDDAIGFRTIEVKGQDILLNGKPIFLRGISIHEEAPLRGGRAFSREDARILLGWAQELGCNFVRLAHYPHNENMTREADRMGLLVWSEIPVYWAIAWENPETFANARNQLRENITRDKNRASIILWSVANETPITERRTAFLTDLANEARRLDPSRPVTAALLHHYEDEEDQRTILLDDPIGTALDVLGCNEYLGWYDGPPEKCDRVEWRTPYDKPMIMSELGAGALAGQRGEAIQRWTEDYQADVYRHQVPMLKRIPFLRGTTPWILMDFRSPRRPLPKIQDYWNRKGLLSQRGQRKLAFYILQGFYRELAGAPTP